MNFSFTCALVESEVQSEREGLTSGVRRSASTGCPGPLKCPCSTAPSASTGDERGLRERDPGDEHDAHGRAGIHALYPHRGEPPGEGAGFPTPAGHWQG